MGMSLGMRMTVAMAVRMTMVVVVRMVVIVIVVSTVAVLAAPSPVLIAWHHGAIPRLVTEIAGKLPGCPAHWPDDRFDLIWILEREAPRAGWSFSQVTQQLLPGDGTDGAPL